MDRVEKEVAQLELKVENEKLRGALAKKRAGTGGDLAECAARFLRRRIDGADDDVDFDLDCLKAPGLELSTGARPKPGEAWRSGLAEVAKFLGERSGAGAGTAGAAGQDPAKMVTYLQSVFLGAHPADKVGPRSVAEMRLLAEVMDSLSQGDLARVSDLLMQRFKAVELASTDGNWHQAKHVDLTYEAGRGLMSSEEKLKATKKQLMELKLAEAKAKFESGRSRAGGDAAG